MVVVRGWWMEKVGGGCKHPLKRSSERLRWKYWAKDDADHHLDCQIPLPIECCNILLYICLCNIYLLCIRSVLMFLMMMTKSWDSPRQWNKFQFVNKSSPFDTHFPITQNNNHNDNQINIIKSNQHSFS